MTERPRYPLLINHCMIPKRCKAIVLRKAGGQSGLYKFDAVLEERDVQPLKDGQVLVRVEAAGFNHRDVSLCCTSFCALSLIYLALDPKRSVPRSKHWDRLRGGRGRCFEYTVPSPSRRTELTADRQVLSSPRPTKTTPFYPRGCFLCPPVDGIPTPADQNRGAKVFPRIPASTYCFLA